MSFASGKIILFGEHSVVYGEPSVVASLAEGIEVDLVPRNGDARLDGRLAEAVACAAGEVGVDPSAFSVRIRSTLPAGVGLGSSAALSVALVRTFAETTGARLDTEEIWKRAWAVENVFHGTSSGVDVAAAAFGGILWYERDRPPKPLTLPAPVDVVVGVGRDERRTDTPVSALRDRAQRLPAIHRALCQASGDATREGGMALRRGDWEGAGDMMNVAHGLLVAFGVSTPELDAMARTACEAGATGAKLSGAGGGGSIVALTPGATLSVAAALTARGYATFVRTIGPTHEEVHDGIDGFLPG